MPITITLPDGSALQLEDGATGRDAALAIGPALAKAAVAVKVDGELRDLTASLPDGATLEVVTDTSEEGRHVIRHSTAHVLAQAVLDLFDGATFAIGPPIDNGFYYDFEVDEPFTPEDLERIEQRMAEIVAEDQPFTRAEVGKEEGLEIFADHRYKREIIESVDRTEGAEGDLVSLYRNDRFVDLCRGPHLPSTGRIPAFKLTRSAGAYWRGDANNPQLQRIYGTAWESRQALDDHLERLEEARRRDHRRLGAELDLYSFPPELGSGLAIWHPKGALARLQIEDYARRIHLEHDYEIVATPHIARAELWRTSRHLENYAEYMYPGLEVDDGVEYRLKPMNCPFHILVYQARGRSYRELPLRLFELGTVYRYERSGVVSGLLRVRGMTQDDAHIFCTESQLTEELQRLLEFVLMVHRDFGFEEFEADLSTIDPDNYIGEEEQWERATQALRAALTAAELPYEEAPGEAAFYGPKIDIHLRDAIGRRWQMSTLQVDFAQPVNFDLAYASSANTPERPVMIHRALLGTIERFFAVLVEHYAGALPGWLSPVQVTVVPVADRHEEYAASVASALRHGGLRVEVDSADETVGEKVRRALTAKHPGVVVVGDDDVEAGTVGLRIRDKEERRDVPLDEAADALRELCAPPR